MATTPAPLVWEFYRQQSSAKNLAGVIHYYDTESQSLYLDSDGLGTKIATIDEGHWKGCEESDHLDISEESWTSVRLDHPSNGIWYGMATNGSSMQFIRYMYAVDVSSILDSWELSEKSDSPVVQLDADLMNIDIDLFASDASLFQPGARIPVKVYLGNTKPYLLSTVFIDEVNYDVSSDTVSISARNLIGELLKDQTFDDTVSFSGTVKSVIEDILELGGVEDYIVQDNDKQYESEFKASDELLSGIETVLKAQVDGDHEWAILEMSDGTIIVGRDDWVVDYIPQSTYSFDEGSDVFSRKTVKTNDAAYSKVRVTGKDADGNELTPVLLDVNTFSMWRMGARKTKHITAEDGMTQEGLQAYAEAQATQLQYVGIGETFSIPFKPELVIGDVAATKNGDETATTIGLITEIKQKFSRKEGFKTEFSVDSGGDYTDENYTIYSRAANVNGYNRRQNIIDIVKMAASNSTGAVKSGDLNEITEADVTAIWNSL